MARSSGTPLFMAPEILAGEPATPRSDLYALGVTLRWALAGRSPFEARTLEELRVEAASGPTTPLAAERPEAPAALVAAIERAMAPRAEARYGSAALLGADLEKVVAAMDAAGARRRRRAAPFAVAGAAVLLVGAAAVFLPRVVGRTVPPRPVRFSVAAPPHTTLVGRPEYSAISPDGRLLALVALEPSGMQRIWIRELASLGARPLEGTEDVNGFFWSPDSRHLGFFARGKLKKIPISGGVPEVLCEAPDPRGGTWGRNGVIVFAPMAAGGLCRVSAEGGGVTEILRPDSTLQETALRWPQFLPDGRRFLFVSLPPRDGDFPVHAGALDSDERRHVMSAGAAPVCAGDRGLIMASHGRLVFQRLDFRRLQPVGDPVALGPATAADASVGQPLASASMNGVLAQPAASLANTQLVWLDRAGQKQGALELPEARYERMFLSPHGRRLLVERRDSPTTVDLWMIELDRGLARRFTLESQSRIGGRPVWSRDGSRIAFSSNRAGTTNIYRRFADGTGGEETLYESSGLFKEVDTWSPDGRYLVFEQADPVTGWDLWLLPLEGDRKPVPYLRSRFNETSASISPDGRWLAYASDATGWPEIYVRSFPTPGAEHVVTSAGGGHAHWSQDGRELLILNNYLDNTVWAAPVSVGETFSTGTPRLLFRAPAALWLTAAPDGERILASVPSGGAEPTTITVELDWPAQLGRADSR
jgi:dipeptidyl aminopeptidase/acylaminoacyl peptidase